MGQETPAPFLEQLDISTGYLLYRVGAETRRRWAQMLSDRDLTPHQFGVLMVLDQVGATSQRGLSTALGIDPRNAVAVIDGLQRRAFVERRPDPVDRRRHAITLTPAGASAVADLQQAGELMERDLVDCLGDGERETLHRLLHKLFDAFRANAG